MRLLSDRNQEVRKYIQEHKLRFRKAQFEANTVELARYYSTLPPQ